MKGRLFDVLGGRNRKATSPNSVWAFYVPGAGLWLMAISMMRDGYQNAPGRRWEEIVFGVAIIFVGVWLFIKGHQRAIRVLRAARGLCPACGHYLGASSNGCPECGRTTGQSIHSGNGWRKKMGNWIRVVYLIVALALIVGLFRSFWFAALPMTIALSVTIVLGVIVCFVIDIARRIPPKAMEWRPGFEVIPTNTMGERSASENLSDPKPAKPEA